MELFAERIVDAQLVMKEGQGARQPIVRPKMVAFCSSVIETLLSWKYSHRLYLARSKNRLYVPPHSRLALVTRMLSWRLVAWMNFFSMAPSDSNDFLVSAR